MENLPLSKTALYRIVKAFRDGILDGNPPEDYCFMVSAPLQAFLETQGVCSWLVPGEVLSPYAKVCSPSRSGIYTHYWLRLESGTIIDATASQFRRLCGRRMPAVYIGPKPEWYFQYGDEFSALRTAHLKLTDKA